MPRLTARDVTFLKLQPAVLCIECELISYNNTDSCLACGSRAVLSLSRVLGGSLKPAAAAKAVTERVLHRASTTVPAYAAMTTQPAFTAPQPAFLRSAMHTVVQQAFTASEADGAALALDQGGKILCTANMGNPAPEIGAEVRADSGISGLCVRTARTLRCDDTEQDANVDVRRCREMGVRSLVVAPVAHLSRVMGVLEVFSSKKYAFDDRHVANVQLMADLMVVAAVRMQVRPLPSAAQP